MNDIRRTKDQLIKELTALRRKAASLEKKLKEKSIPEKTCPRDFFVNAPLPYGKHAELMLEASEKRFRSALEGMQLIGVMLNRKGEITFCNDFLLDLTGWKRKEVLRKNWFRLFLPPETRAHIRKTVFLKTIETGDFPSYYQNEILTRDGKRRLIAWNNTVLKDAKGDVVSVTSIGEDITERKQAEQALQTQTHLLHALIDGIPDIIALQKPDHTILFYNKAGYDFLKKEPEEVDGRKCYRFLGRSSPCEKCATSMAIRSKKIEVVEKFLPDYQIWLEARAIPVLDEKNELQAVVEILRDITERKQAEEALKESEEKFRLLFHGLKDAVYVHDVSPQKPGRFIAVNESACRMLGYTEEELLRLNVKDIDVPEQAERIRAIQEKLFRDGHVLFKTSHVAKNRRKIPVEINVRLFTLRGKAMVLSVARDISERIQAEEKIKIYHKRLSELASKIALIAEDERRRFADELHDLTGQNLALAKIKLSELRELAADKGIVNQVDELYKLIEEAGVSTRALTFELSPPILYEIGFEAAAEWLGEQILRKYNIAFYFEDDTQTKPLSDEAKVLLFVSLRELIVNIGKHSKARNATVTLGKAGNMLHVSVTDDGIGFDASSLDFQIMKATSFGLFSTRERLERLGGRLEIVSQPGKGTTVTMVMPLKE